MTKRIEIVARPATKPLGPVGSQSNPAANRPPLEPGQSKRCTGPGEKHRFTIYSSKIPIVKRMGTTWVAMDL